MIDKILGTNGVGVMAALATLVVALVLYRSRTAIGKAMEAHVSLPFRTVISSRDHLTTLIGVTTNITFLGTAVGALFGYTGDSREAYLLGGLLGLLAAWFLVRLSRLSAELAKAEASAGHRRMAGTVRSIVRDEIEAARRKAAAAAGARRVSKPVCCCKAYPALKPGVLSRNRRKFRQPINVACPAPGRWGRPNSRVTSRHFDHGNASRTSRPDCSGLDEAD